MLHEESLISFTSAIVSKCSWAFCKLLAFCKLRPTLMFLSRKTLPCSSSHVRT